MCTYITLLETRMGASGLLESKNDHLIDELLVDPNYKIKDGKIFTRLTLNGQGISDDWREVGYQKADGYVRFRYKGEFLFAQRVMYQWAHGDLKPDMVINHKNLDNSDNRPSNLEQTTQHDNNKKKHKKYKKHKKSCEHLVNQRLREENMLKNASERIVNAYLDEKYKVADEHYFLSKIDLEVDSDFILSAAKIKKDDLDGIKTKNVNLKWKDLLSYRRSGLDISAVIPDQKLDIIIEVYANADGDTEEKEISIDIKDAEVEYGRGGSKGSYEIFPVSIEVDKKGKATVKFDV